VNALPVLRFSIGRELPLAAGACHKAG
jgi:hypothetical protein